MNRLSELLENKWTIIQLLIYVSYLILHLLSLTALPVFADEAIYIRWSQLIIDDWQQYFFFALNDGKTPLFIWLMIPFLKIIEDQLFAARLLIVIVGGLQVFAIKKLVEAFNGKKVSQSVGMLLVSLLPFWYIHHRMALMDGLMTLLLSFTLLFLVKILQELNARSHKKLILYVGSAGIFFGLAILSKLPSLFFAPIFTLISIYPLFSEKNSVSFRRIFWIGVAGFIGCVIFLLLKVHPAFGQLFSRGKDFSYSFHEVISGEWIKSISNTRIFLTWFLYYFSPFLAFFVLTGLYLKKTRKIIVFLLISLFIFWLPFVILGKVVYPRYLLPSAIFLTIIISVVVEKAMQYSQHIRIAAQVSFMGMLAWSLYFISLTLVNADKTPFIAVDRVQYLMEWSSGHGIKEAVEFIQENAKNKRVLVATEGRFGTLPDGILLNLHNQDVTNIEIWELGVAPIWNLPVNFDTKAATADMTLLLVNSHRMKVQDPRFRKIISYPRPYNAPTFDVYEFNPNETH